MAKPRYSSALGVATAMEEVERCHLDEAMRSHSSWSRPSSTASCSPGAELGDCHILIIASDTSPGGLRALSSYVNDAMDARAITRLLEQVDRDRGSVLQVIAKAEPDPTNTIRGKKHTMNRYNDSHSTRHTRPAVGGSMAGLVGETRLYAAGGAEGQGPPNGAPDA